MPDKETLKRAQQDARKGKAVSTQAGEFVREEMDHIREGKHGARSAKQAIAIGLSKARRAGVALPPPKGKGQTETVKKRAAKDFMKGQLSPNKPVSKTRSNAVTKALKKEGSAAASPTALSRQAHTSARKRGPANLSAAAKKALRPRVRQDARVRRSGPPVHAPGSDSRQVAGFLRLILAEPGLEFTGHFSVGGRGQGAAFGVYRFMPELQVRVDARE